MKKSFFAGVLTALVFLCLICTAYATVGKTTWEVDYNDIKIKIRGQEVVPKNSNGEPVEPIAYEGTTYLPVRAVGTALGLDVAWDGNTNTVLLDDPSEQKLEELNSNMHYTFSGLIHYMSVFREIGLAAIIDKKPSSELQEIKAELDIVAQKFSADMAEVEAVLQTVMDSTGYAKEDFLFFDYYSQFESLMTNTQNFLAVVDNYCNNRTTENFNAAVNTYGDLFASHYNILKDMEIFTF